MLLSKQSDLLNEQLISLDRKIDSLSNVLIKNNNKSDNSFRAILEIYSIPTSVREAGTGGAEKIIFTPNYENSSMLINLARKIDKINHQLQIQEMSYDEISETAKNWIKEINSIPSIMPISGNDLMMISSTYGTRMDPFLYENANHHGYDYVAKIGTKVYATGEGIVTLLNYSRKGYGNEVIIDHSFGFNTRYAHLDKILVEKGDSITRGQVIGLVGNTGRSTGPHLHYEVRYMNQPVNPFFYYSDDLSGEEYEIMVRNINSKN